MSDAGSNHVSCPFCEGEIGAKARKCRYCGEWVARSCVRCGTPVRGEWAAQGVCAECMSKSQVPLLMHSQVPAKPVKSRGVAAFSALLLGGLGAHRFYLGNPVAGFVYILFCWTLIPSAVGILEGIRFALMDDDVFHERYSK